jgi:mono/diheme cytochrome c family protein
MATVAFVVAFLALGAAVAFVAFSGGPSQAREAYLTKGRRGFRIAIPILYIALGIAVPALVLANRPSAEGNSGTLAAKEGNHDFNAGKKLFRATCWSCHTLKAAGAKGVTGPNLDQIGQITKQRVLNALRIGGTGDKRMPAGLLTGSNAQAVATFVSSVAGRGNP